jgi:CRISPR-associated protein Cmr4
MALRLLNGEMGEHIDYSIEEGTVYKEKKDEKLNLGWLYLPVRDDGKWMDWTAELIKYNIPKDITEKLGVVSDKLFAHLVNSNLEVRTSVAINPETGAAKDKALFSYEALPRSTVLYWELTCRNPNHFRIDKEEVKSASSPEEVKDIVVAAHSYLEHLGIGGMGSRGMGRLRVFPERNGE